MNCPNESGIDGFAKFKNPKRGATDKLVCPCLLPVLGGHGQASKIRLSVAPNMVFYFLQNHNRTTT